MALLDIHDVTRTVTLPDGDDLHILRGVNLTVEPGDHVSIVGRSGTGKSTLLNIIGLLDKPTSGTYSIDGVDTSGLGEGKRSALRGSSFGFVFQQFNIFSARTALQNVEVPLLYAAGRQFWNRRNLAADMLERVGLGDRLDSYPTQMSGGEQQRIAIARALVRTPRVILADEPTGALDPHTGRIIMELLEDVAAENNAALIVITHDMNVAARASRAYSLYDGILHNVDDLSEHTVAAVSDGVPVMSQDAGHDQTPQSPSDMPMSNEGEASAAPELCDEETDTATIEEVTVTEDGEPRGNEVTP